MDSRTAPERAPSAEAIEFVRFCYRRRRVGWPELYDEMCAVAGRGLFRGWGCDDLTAQGIGLTLFELPALAALVARVIAEEHEQRTRIAAASVRIALQAVDGGRVDRPVTDGDDAADTTETTGAGLRFAAAGA